MNTLLLDQTLWDLTKDAAGNIAMATNPYAVAQDVASACRLFLGELWYDTTQGVPYFENVLGRQIPLALLRSYLETAAKTVPEVEQVRVFITGFVDRRVTGQVQVTTSAGVTLPIAL